MDQNIKQIISNNQDTIAPVVGKYLQDKSVLDVGCGNGINSLLISERYDAQMTLLDVNDIRSEDAFKFPFIKSSIDKISLEDKKFDVAFVQYVIHHISSNISLPNVFKELKRVAKTIVIIEEITCEKTNLKVALEFDERINKIIHPNHELPIIRHYSDTELKELFSQSGLNIIEEKLLNPGSEETGYLQNKAYILTE